MKALCLEQADESVLCMEQTDGSALYGTDCQEHQQPEPHACPVIQPKPSMALHRPFMSGHCVYPGGRPAATSSGAQGMVRPVLRTQLLSVVSGSVHLPAVPCCPIYPGFRLFLLFSVSSCPVWLVVPPILLPCWRICCGHPALLRSITSDVVILLSLR